MASSRTRLRAFFSTRGFQIIVHHRFQLGFNNLFVFRRDTFELDHDAGAEQK